MSSQIKHGRVAGLFPLMFHARLIAALINREKRQVNTDRRNSRRDALSEEKSGYVLTAVCRQLQALRVLFDLIFFFFFNWMK